MVSELPEEYNLTLTISSRDVSGSMTTVYVSVPVRVLPPITAEPDTTVMEVAVSVIADARVVCCAREEYLRTVIVYLSDVMDAGRVLLKLRFCFFIKTLCV
jgi:hypothetical protein